MLDRNIIDAIACTNGLDSHEIPENIVSDDYEELLTDEELNRLMGIK